MENGRREWLSGVVMLALCCGGATAHAIPAPIPEKRLESSAHAIVEGLVVMAHYLKVERNGQYATAHYRGALKVRRVKKGDIKPGAILPLRWALESWIGKGRQPVGRGRKPVFYTCEVVRVFLWKSKGKYHVSGRRLVNAPPTYKAPTPKRRTLRCVKGRVK